MKKEYDFSKAKRGPVVHLSGGKTRITIRLDDAVLDWFRKQVDRAGGGNYQTLINDTLRQYIAKAEEPLEVTLRRVIREEIRRASWIKIAAKSSDSFEDGGGRRGESWHGARIFERLVLLEFHRAVGCVENPNCWGRCGGQSFRQKLFMTKPLRAANTTKRTSATAR
jgi:hypothetical protein